MAFATLFNSAKFIGFTPKRTRFRAYVREELAALKRRLNPFSGLQYEFRAKVSHRRRPFGGP